MPPYTLFDDGGSGMTVPSQFDSPDLVSDTWHQLMQPQIAANPWIPQGGNSVSNANLTSALEQASYRQAEKPYRTGGRRENAVGMQNMSEVMHMQTSQAPYTADMMMSSLPGGAQMRGNADGGCFTASLAEEEGMRASAILNGSQVSPPPEWAAITTVMMRNLPNKYTQRMLLTEINCTGFLGSFDFLYLPIDPETNANRGYAFLNFIGPSFAWMFKMSYEGNKMNRFNSNKVVSVVPATLQGFEANYAHYASARVNRGDPAARPLFLREPSQQLTNLTKAGGGRSEQASGRGADGRRGGRQRRNNAGHLEHLLVAQMGGQGQQPEFMGGQEQPGGWGFGVAGMADPYFAMDGGMSSQCLGAEGPDSSPREAPQQAAAAPQGGAAPMVARFCPHCGGSIQPLFQFCPQCGASLSFSASGCSGGAAAPAPAS